MVACGMYFLSIDDEGVAVEFVVVEVQVGGKVNYASNLVLCRDF